MTNNKLTDEQVVTLQLRIMSALSFYRQRPEKEAKNMAGLLTLCGIAASELQERRKDDSDGMSAGNYCYHYKAEGENGCYAGVANVSDQVVDWNAFQAFKIKVGRLNGDKITSIPSLSFLGEVNKS